jgi:hypothetical protein
LLARLNLKGHMIADELGQQLHDTGTRGGALTAQEQAQLDEWYRQQDASESQSISRSNGKNPVTALRSQVGEALAQLQAMAADLQKLAGANETLRHEVTALRERVAQRPAPQPA